MSAILKIDAWFLGKIRNAAELAKQLKKQKLTNELLLKAKQAGFSDWQVGNILGKDELAARALRKKM